MAQKERENFEGVYEETRVGIMAMYGLWDLLTENPDERTGRGWLKVFCLVKVLEAYLGERVDLMRKLHHEEVDVAKQREAATRKTKVQEREFSSTKTESSAQSVDLTPACLDALKKHRARQAQEKLLAGEKYQDLDLIFPISKGTPWDDINFVKQVFHPALKDAGLRHIRFHDLRHTCASLLIFQGESPKYIQRQMRHASIQMTFDRYGHLFPDANREAARRLDATLFGSGRDKAFGATPI